MPIRERVLKTSLWLIILGALVMRIAVAAQFNPIDHVFSDPARHWHFAQDTLDQEPLKFTDPIGYQMWLAEIAQITTGDRNALAVYAGVMSIMTAFVWYLFFRELLPKNATAALLGFAIISWLPSWIGIFSYFMTETLLLPLLGLSLWATLRTCRLDSLSSYLLATVLWLLTSLTRAIALPLAVVSLIWCLVCGTGRLKKVALAIVAAFILLFPPAYRTHVILGVWAPLGYPAELPIYCHSYKKKIEIEFFKEWTNTKYSYVIQSPSMDDAPLAPLSQWKTSRQGSVKLQINLNAGAYAWEKLTRMYEAPNITAWLRDTGENALYLVFGKSWPDDNEQHFWEKVSIDFRWVWAPLLLASCLGNYLYLLRYRRLGLIPLLTMIGWLVCLLLSVAVSEGRYRKPLEGMIVANCLWLYAAFSRIRADKPRISVEADNNSPP